MLISHAISDYDKQPSHRHFIIHLCAGHFTQVVWKGSRELGVGKAKDGKGKCIVVGSYRPAGNLIGSYGNNVFPPSK